MDNWLQLHAIIKADGMHKALVKAGYRVELCPDGDGYTLALYRGRALVSSLRRTTPRAALRATYCRAMPADERQAQEVYSPAMMKKLLAAQRLAHEALHGGR